LKNTFTVNPFDAKNLEKPFEDAKLKMLVPSIDKSIFSDSYYISDSSNSSPSRGRQLCGLFNPAFQPPGIYTRYISLSQSPHRKQWKKIFGRKFGVQLTSSTAKQLPSSNLKQIKCEETTEPTQLYVFVLFISAYLLFFFF
jgi:hypothetical protein